MTEQKRSAYFLDLVVAGNAENLKTFCADFDGAMLQKLVSTKYADDRTALSWASRRGHIDVISYLLELGADASVVDRTGATALSWAARNGHERAVDLLLCAGADPLQEDSDSWCPLMWAAMNGKSSVVACLLALLYRREHALHLSPLPGELLGAELRKALEGVAGKGTKERLQRAFTCALTTASLLAVKLLWFYGASTHGEDVAKVRNGLTHLTQPERHQSVFEWAIEKQKWGLVEFFASVGFDCETPFVISERKKLTSIAKFESTNAFHLGRQQRVDDLLAHALPLTRLHASILGLIADYDYAEREEGATRKAAQRERQSDRDAVQFRAGAERKRQ